MCKEDADTVKEWRDGETRKAIAINNTYQLAPWADIIYACDMRWWDKYHDRVMAATDAEYWCYHDNCHKKYGFNQYPFKVTGGNGGYQALRLAVAHFKASRVVLLGFDMQGGHWHGQHPAGFPNPTGHNFKIWIGWLQRLAVEFSGVEIINASRETALDCFPRLDLKSALC